MKGSWASPFLIQVADRIERLEVERQRRHMLAFVELAGLRLDRVVAWQGIRFACRGFRSVLELRLCCFGMLLHFARSVVGIAVVAGCSSSLVVVASEVCLGRSFDRSYHNHWHLARDEVGRHSTVAAARCLGHSLSVALHRGASTDLAACSWSSAPQTEFHSWQTGRLPSADM